MDARPFGRSLADFGELSIAEQKLLQDCRRGKRCIISKSRPAENAKTISNTVRAGFLRFLILGGDTDNPVHEHGVRIRGAWIEGELDMKGVTSGGDVWVQYSWFDVTPMLRDAHIKGSLVMTRSRMPGFEGGRLVCVSSVFFNEVLSEGTIKLHGARIDGNMHFKHAKLSNPAGSQAGNESLSADRINVRGDVTLTNGFIAHGEVSLRGAKVGSILDCSGGRFFGPFDHSGPCGDSLSADNILVEGESFFTDGFEAVGTVRFQDARVVGTVECSESLFETGDRESLCFQGLSADTLILRDLKKPLHKIDLSFARIRVLSDERDVWGDELDLDGFTYDRLAKRHKNDVDSRLDWINKQAAEWSGKDGNSDQFRPQPWLQLRMVLREAGHAEDARKVGIAFEERRRWCGQVNGRVPRTFHCMYGRIIGYGYRPMNLFYWSIGVWLGCGAIYDVAAYHKVFAPTEHSIYESATSGVAVVAPLKEIKKTDWVFAPPFGGNYPAFHPFAYSLNVLLPVVDLGQESAWAPVEKPFSKVLLDNVWEFVSDPGSIVQFIIWFETLFGWVAGLLLVAVVSGLARKQDDS